MQHKEEATGEGLISPAADAPVSQPMHSHNNPTGLDLPSVAFVISMVAARYGLPLPWAAIVAAAAGLGGAQ